jgi:WD40 repeat protein
MARVFISHSSRDREPTERMRHWLQEQGFATPFLDFDKHSGIPPGADWERTLYRELETSEAVLIIQTPNWLESKWCFAEFTQARALGKPIFPVIETPTGETLIAPDIQALDLRLDREGGLAQLGRELARIALDAQGGFAWDSSRPPYPGLMAFQEEDAAIYFGRDDDIRRLIERLNARRTQGGIRLIALLGASGSGKSSLLRAGVVPRLKRTPRNWVVVPPMRPQLYPIDELARAMAIAWDRPGDWRSLRGDLQEGDERHLVTEWAQDIRMAAAAPEAQVLLAFDQAEELFSTADPGQARRFIQILAGIASASTPVMGILALRSDFLEPLQRTEPLAGKFEEFSLGPLPLARVPQIIEGPARVAGLKVDDGLVLEASRDAATEDALPLLAFALRELKDRHGNDDRLTLDDYRALGDPREGLSPLENAVRKAADEVIASPGAGEAELRALREAFIPALVRVNDAGEYVRRPAVWTELPAAAHQLLERLVGARLLVRRQEGEVSVVEVTHEALLRKWPRLRVWLDEERSFLIGRQQLEQDLRDWQTAGDAEKAGALLSGLKLHRAESWLVERPQQLSADERAFVRASAERARADEQRRRRYRWWTMAASLAAALVLAVVATVAFLQSQEAQKATARALDLLRISLASQWQSTDPTKAAQVLVEVQDPAIPGAQRKLGELMRLPLIQAELPHAAPATFAAFSPKGGQIVTLSQDKTARVWDALSGKPLTAPLAHDQAVTSAEISSDERLLLTQSRQSVKLWDITAGDVRQTWQYENAVAAIGFDANSRTAAAAAGKDILLYDVKTGKPKFPVPWQLEEEIVAIAFAPAGGLVAVAPKSGRVRIWNFERGVEVRENEGPRFDDIQSLSWSPSGSKLLTASWSGVNVWEVTMGDSWSNEASVEKAWWNPDGSQFLTIGREGAQLWWQVGVTYSNRTLEHENKERFLTAMFRGDGIGPVTLTGTGFSPERGFEYRAYGRPPSPTTLGLWSPSETGPASLASLPYNGELLAAAFAPHVGLVATLWGERGGSGRGETFSPDRFVQLWNVEISGERFSRVLPGTIPEVMRDDFVATVAGEDVRFWDLVSGYETPTGPLHHDRPVRSFSLSPDGTRAATATDRAIHIWEIPSGAPARPVAVHPMERAETLSFDPTGQFLRSIGYSGINIWNVSTWDRKLPDAPKDCYGDPILMDTAWQLVLRTCGDQAYAWAWDGSRFNGPRSRPHSGHAYNSAVSPEGRLVATASAAGVEIWEAATGVVQHSVSLGAPADRIAFGANGRAMAVVDRDRKLYLIDVISGELRWKTDGSSGIGRVEFTRHDELLVTEEQGLLQMRKAAGGDPGARILLSDHGDAAWSLVGDDVALTRAGNRARLWSLTTGEPLFLQPFSHPAREQGSSLASGEIKYGLTSRGNAYLVTATASQTFEWAIETRVWAIGPEPLRKALRRVVHTCLPIADRVAALGQTADRAEIEYKECAARLP